MREKIPVDLKNCDCNAKFTLLSCFNPHQRLSATQPPAHSFPHTTLVAWEELIKQNLLGSSTNWGNNSNRITTTTTVIVIAIKKKIKKRERNKIQERHMMHNTIAHQLLPVVKPVLRHWLAPSWPLLLSLYTEHEVQSNPWASSGQLPWLCHLCFNSYE